MTDSGQQTTGERNARLSGSSSRMWARRVLPLALRNLLRPLADPLNYRRLAGWLGLETRLPLADRALLEGTILPHFAGDPDFRRIVFIGCDWYTRGYWRIFGEREFWTIDHDPAKARFGRRGRHITGAMEDLERWFQPRQTELVVCNGVVGWGLNRRADAERAFGASYEILRPGGVLILGWNDVPARQPFALREVAQLRRFLPHVFPPLGVAHVETPTTHRHVFDFLEKTK